MQSIMIQNFVTIEINIGSVAGGGSELINARMHQSDVTREQSGELVAWEIFTKVLKF